jgi:predicted regulator of amino acid metabolism with ACT domain
MPYYSVRIEGRSRKTSFKGSRHKVYEKLHKKGYSYDRKKRIWISSVEVYETVIYGIFARDKTQEYTIVEITLYTKEQQKLEDLFKIIEKYADRMIRYGTTDRITVSDRKIVLAKDMKLTEDVDSAIKEGLDGAFWEKKSHHERMGSEYKDESDKFADAYYTK